MHRKNKRDLAQTAYRVSYFLRTHRTALLTDNGFLWAVIGAWWVHPVLGCAMISVSSFVLAELTKPRG